MLRWVPAARGQLDQTHGAGAFFDKMHTQVNDSNITDRIRFYKEDLDFGLWVWERLGCGKILTLVLLCKTRFQGWGMQLMPGMATGLWDKHRCHSLSGIHHLKLWTMTSSHKALRLAKTFLESQPSGFPSWKRLFTTRSRMESFWQASMEAIRPGWENSDKNKMKLLKIKLQLV